MFDGDTSNAGRRERLMRMRGSKDQYTDKIGSGLVNNPPKPSYGGSSYQGSEYGGTPAHSVRSSAHGHGASNVFPTDGCPSFMGDRPSALDDVGKSSKGHSQKKNFNSAFTQRMAVKRHAYEVEVVCRFPITDMTSNQGRRQISWFCDVEHVSMSPDLAGSSNSCTVQVPQGYDVGQASFINQDFANGKCCLSIPAVSSSVFN